MGGDDSAVVEVEETQQEEKTQEDASSGDREFPYSSSAISRIIWGLPPVNRLSDEASIISHPEVVNAAYDAQNSIFMNSFPILSITPVEVGKSSENATGVDRYTRDLMAGSYKFAIQNKGSVSYSLSNEYGPSMIEEGFNQVASKANLITQFHQMMKANRLGKQMATDLGGAFGSKLQEAYNNIQNDIKGFIGDVGDRNAGQLGRDATQKAGEINSSARNLAGGLSSIASSFLDTLLYGQKIDIPNIWTGSSSNISQTFNIVLHSAFPDNDTDFKYRILYPLNIIFALSAPYSYTKKANSNNDGSKSNDIISYENPPYIRASIDGVFETKLGAITSCNIDIPYERFSLAKGGRPYIVNVTLTIQDLYNVLIYNDELNQFTPNGKDIINTMEKHTKDEAVPEISKVYASYVIPSPAGHGVGVLSDMFGVMGEVSNAISSVVSEVRKVSSFVSNFGVDTSGIDSAMSDVESYSQPTALTGNFGGFF